jgi:tripartite-type tricarboxylate transporter receptor subunit TctC
MRLPGGLLALLLLLPLACGRPVPYPDGPVLIVCPWAAGGGTDRVARQVAALLEQELKVPVNVVNATGGDGVTGHAKGALARPDGQTLTLVTVELNMLHWRGLTRLSHRDFEPGMLVNRDAAALFVRTDAPWTSLKELEAAVRAKPGALRASGTARAAIWHVALAGWLEKIGSSPTDIVWVSIGGSAPSLAELSAGGVDMVCCSLPEASAFLDSGKVRSLGVMAAERHPGFPDVPTFRELGTPWELGGYRGISFPKGTPPEIRAKLLSALDRALRNPAWHEFMRTAGFGEAAEGPEAFLREQERYDAELGAILGRPGFQDLSKDRFGPYFFPGLLAAALIFALAGLAAKGALRFEQREGTRWRRALGPVLAIVFYIAAAESLGFILAGAVLLAFLLRRSGASGSIALLLPAALMPALYALFAGFLRVPLPRGPWGW